MTFKLLPISKSRLVCGALFITALTFAFLLYPRTGVGDTDAIIYIIGTHSIKDGRGYSDFSGNAITTWPPGYSLLLSLFPLKPLDAATLLNAIAFAVATVMVYLLARLNQWSTYFAICFAGVIAAGFFRSIAFFAKPDILTYALFFAGLFLYWQQPFKGSRFWAFTIWNLMIPIKLVAAVITPAALLSEFLITFRQPGNRVNVRPYIYPTLSWLVSLGGLLLYNRLVSSDIMPQSHAPASLSGFFQEIADFMISIPRTALAYWYGTLRDPIALTLFGVTLLLGIFALFTLRPDSQERQRWYFGGLLLLLTLLLLVVRKFDAQMRTMGFGVLTLVFLFRPILTVWSRRLWAGYLGIMMVLAVANVLLVNAQGANHLMYETLVEEIIPSLPRSPDVTIYSNGYELLDIHAGIPSTPTTTLPPANRETYLFWVDLPNVDGIMTSVMPLPTLNHEWCSKAEGNGGALYEQCRP